MRRAMIAALALTITSVNLVALADEPAKSEQTKSEQSNGSSQPSMSSTTSSDTTTADTANKAQSTEVKAPAPQDVVPGPLENERKALYATIKTAEKDGVGVSGYMMAFKAIEKSVTAGDSEQSLRPRIAKLMEGLSWQQKTSVKNGGAGYAEAGRANGYRIGKEMAKRILQGK